MEIVELSSVIKSRSGVIGGCLGGSGYSKFEAKS